MKKHPLLALVIGLSVQNGDALACTVNNLLYHDAFQYQWACNTTVGYWQNTDETWPALWWAAVEDAGTAWNGHLGKIKLAKLTNPPSSSTNAFEWRVEKSNWPADAATAPGFTVMHIATDPNNLWVKKITTADAHLNLKTFGEADYTTACETGKVPIDQVVKHEMGHGVGLNHADCGGNVMNAEVFRGDCTISLGPLDTEAAKLLYMCTAAYYLAVLSGEECTCYSGSPDAAIEDFRCIDGIASWYTLFETGTKEYAIESSDEMAGPWTLLAIEEAGVGEHKVEVAQVQRLVRLTEIEQTGTRRIQALDRACRKGEIAPGSNRNANHLSDAHGTLEPESLPLAPATSCTAWASSPDYVVFTVGSLFNRVDCTIGHHRELEGHQVRVINLDGVQGDIAEFIRTTIQTYHAEFGTKYFHLVGTWSDDFSSLIWQTDEYWRAKREAFLEDKARAPAASAPGTQVPPILTSAPNAVKTAASTPYVYSDQPYGDIDNDGIPDVVVTRWPFTTEAQVQAAYNKLAEYHAFSAPEKALFLGADLNSLGFEAELVRAAVDEEIAALDPSSTGQSTSELYLSDYDLEDWNSETADRINSVLPDAVFILGYTSASYKPGQFFSKSLAIPWQMSMLDPFVYARIIVAASCNGADFADATQYGSASCVDFLSASYQGAMLWVGPTGSSIQAANALVSVRLIEEMYGNPYRPMAESWLVAMQRSYQDVSASENYGDLLPTLASYVFLGDPLTPLAPKPLTMVTSFVDNSYDHVLRSANNAPLVSCPKGDGDKLVVNVDMNAQQVAPYATASNLTLTPPPDRNSGNFQEGKYVSFQEGAVSADNFSLLNANTYRGTFTVENIGGNGVDSALVSFYGVPVGWAKFKAKSFDIIPVGNTFGKVDGPDFANFSTRFQSSVCNCVYTTKQYSQWSDFMKYGDSSHTLPDTMVSGPDFAFFGTHFNHQYTPPQFSAHPTRALASGSIQLEFQEEQPLIGQRKLRASVRMQGVDPFVVMMLGLKNDNPIYRFAGWVQDAAFPGTTMCAQVDRDGIPQVMVGIASDSGEGIADQVLGYFEIDVLSEDPIAFSEDDFDLILADILLENGEERMLYGGGQSFSRVLVPASFSNALAQNYPNPFNPQTVIAYSLKGRSDVRLTVYDVGGRRVRELVNEQRSPGIHRVVWDGRDLKGTQVASGVYFYKLAAGDFVDTKKMIMLK